MTRRRQEVLTAIRAFLAAHDCAPTLGQLSKMLDRSKPTIWEHVQELRRAGLIELAGKNGRIALTERCGSCGAAIDGTAIDGQAMEVTP